MADRGDVYFSSSGAGEYVSMYIHMWREDIGGLKSLFIFVGIWL